MSIITKEITIKKPEKITTQYIEQELTNLFINPIRWAIVQITRDTIILDIACVE